MGTTREGEAGSRRAVRRCHEMCRLEEQLWTMVFEELWPVVSRSTRREPVAAACGEAGEELERCRTHAEGA